MVKIFIPKISFRYFENFFLLRKSLFFFPMFFILLFAYFILTFPDKTLDYIQVLFSYITFNFGSFFLLFGFFSFLILLWILFSPVGEIKLGKKDDKPQFTYFEWLSLLFCSGIGISIMLWGLVESLHYIEKPPYNIPASSSLSYEWAHMIPFFHWGISAWAIYCLPTVLMSYAFYVKGIKTLKFSSMIKALGLKVENKFLYMFIDLIIIFAVLGGVATSLSLAVPLVSTFFEEIFGFSTTLYTKLGMLFLLFCLFTLSTTLGLTEGLKKLSLVNAYLAVFFILFVFILGPTNFITNISTNTIGLFFNNFLRMSFYTDPIKKTGWVQDWTIFYWGWWIAYTPMMAIFVTKISKGRTLKEMIIALCISGSLGCWFILGVLGGYAIYLHQNGIVDLLFVLENRGIEYTSVEIIKQLPYAKFALFLYLILAFIFSATTFDSSAYTLSSMTSEEDKSNDPSLKLRIFWCLSLSVLALCLLLINDYKAIQLSSIIVAIPMMIIIVVSSLYFLKNVARKKI